MRTIALVLDSFAERPSPRAGASAAHKLRHAVTCQGLPRRSFLGPSGGRFSIAIPVLPPRCSTSFRSGSVGDGDGSFPRKRSPDAGDRNAALCRQPACSQVGLQMRRRFSRLPSAWLSSGSSAFFGHNAGCAAGTMSASDRSVLCYGRWESCDFRSLQLSAACCLPNE